MIQNKTQKFLLLICLPFFLMCRDGGSRVDLLEADFIFKEEIDRILLYDVSRYDGRSDYSVSWSSDMDIEFLKNDNGSYYFLLSENDEDLNVEITMTIKVGKSKDEITKSILVPKLGLHRKYGLGLSLTEDVSNNVDYNWYVDQGSTGEYARINCGPACAEMAIRWTNDSFEFTAEQLRDKQGHTDLWRTNEVFSSLRNESVKCEYINFHTFADLKSELDAGYITILCLDIYYVREADSDISEWRKDKFYTNKKAETGHFLIVKGYKKVDGNYLLECYDPWSMGETYKDGQFKGQDRYYRVEDILKASSLWWKYAISVAKDRVLPVHDKLPTRAESHYLDPADVPSQQGA